MTALLTITGLHKSFRNHSVLRGLSLSIEKGDCVLLLGANGAGKSTLLRICAGLTRADQGEVVFSGKPARKKGDGRNVGYCSHDHMLYRNLTVLEQLELSRDLGSVDFDVREQLRAWDLNEYKNRQIDTLSKGLQYRVSLCRTFAASPRFLLLDEPTSALDNASVERLCAEISRVTDGGGFALIATHDLHRLADAANRVVVIEEGVVARDSEGGKAKKIAAVEYYQEVNH